jgi:hypothetical protein
VLSIHNVMACPRPIIAPLGYAHTALVKAGTPCGATSISQGGTLKPGEDTSPSPAT